MWLKRSWSGTVTSPSKGWTSIAADGASRSRSAPGRVELPSGEFYVSVIRDITERKQTQTLQEAVYRIAAAAETTRSLDELYPQIHQIISSVMPAENFYITLYDEAQNLLRFPYFKDAEDEPFMGGIQPGKGLTAYVLRTGKSLLCTQAVHDELERQGEVKLLGVASAIWLGVPLIVEGKTIGAMVVQHYTDPKAYGEREQHMLEFVSTQVAIAINRKRSEEEIRSLNTELEQRVDERTRDLRLAQDKIVRQEKLAVLGQLAGGVGHELRNPLGIINTSIYYLKLVQPDADEKVKQYHAMIEQEVRTTPRRSSTTCWISPGVESADQEPVAVRELVQRTLERFPVPAWIETTIRSPRTCRKFYADPRQMEQVLGNLVTNACQAMEPRGTRARLAGRVYQGRQTDHLCHPAKGDDRHRREGYRHGHHPRKHEAKSSSRSSPPRPRASGWGWRSAEAGGSQRRADRGKKRTGQGQHVHAVFAGSFHNCLKMLRKGRLPGDRFDLIIRECHDCNIETKNLSGCKIIFQAILLQEARRRQIGGMECWRKINESCCCRPYSLSCWWH